MKQTKRRKAKSAKKTKSKPAKRTQAKPQRSKAGPQSAMHPGAHIVRVLQERLQPGHWANADQLQRWLIEDAVAKLVRAGYLEKFGEDGMGLTEKGRAHKGPVVEGRQE